LPAAPRPRERGARIVGALARPAKRLGTSFRGIRSAGETAAWKFSAGIFARRAHSCRANPPRRRRAAPFRRLNSPFGRGDETPDQILNSDDSAQTLLIIQDSSQPKTRGTQSLDNTVGWFLLGGQNDSPHVIAERLGSISFEQDIENVDQAGGLTFARNHWQTIQTWRCAQLKRFLG